MSLETVSTLEEETFTTLQKLVRRNLDSAEGYEAAADMIEHRQLKSFFTSIAADRNDMADEIQTPLSLSGESAAEQGSWIGGFHRVWMDFRGKLNDGDPAVILIEAERGEDHIKKAYEDALSQTSGSTMNSVLLKQYRRIKKVHDAIRDLRDFFNAR